MPPDPEAHVPAPTVDHAPLRRAVDEALAHLADAPKGRVGPTADRGALHDLLGGPLPTGPTDATEVIDRLVAAGDGLMRSQSPRFFGFVVGGAHPAAIAADWLASAWDQNAGLYDLSPTATVVERIAADWVVDLLGLPEQSSVGFVTGAQMATWTCLAAARHQVLATAGWDVEARGLRGAPQVHVVAGARRHGTIDRALRFLGFGTDEIVEVPADAAGRMRLDDLEAAVADLDGPMVVIAQAGEVNTGAVDPVGRISAVAHDHGAWVHVDGAFGLWAQASRRHRHLTAGVEQADSWSVDAHKWLNVPYDSAMAIVAHPDAHRAALGAHADYLVHDEDVRHDPLNWNPEHSRRARGFAVWTLLRTLGRDGVEDLVDRLCARARQFAERLAAVDGVEVLNEVVLNQVLVRFTASDDPDAHTRAVLRRVQQEGTCWMSGTTWHGQAAMRVSVSNWATTEDDVDRSVEAILRCAQLDGRDGREPDAAP